MATTPNVGLDLPDEEKTVADEVRRLAGNLVLLDDLIKALQTLVSQKAVIGHTHTLAQITGLVDELAAKMSADRQFSLSDLVDVIGSVNAPPGYIFVKRIDGKYEFISSAAAIGTHKHIAADIIDFDDKVTSKFTNLIGGAPAALDTLYELAAALGNDANFATTVNNKIAATTANANGKVTKTGDTMTGDLRISKAYPILSLFYPGVEHKRLYVENDGSLIIGNGDNGRVDLRLYSSGVLNVAAHMQVGNGNAILHQDGNIQGPVWGGYLSNYVYNTAEARASAQGQAWANDRVAALQYRLVSRGAANGSGEAPEGAVLTGVWHALGGGSGSRVWRYPQVYDPVRGWVGFSNQ